MKPQDAVAAMSGKSEETVAAQEDICDTRDLRKAVIELIGGGEKLMFANVQSLSLF